jgi:hypothetical protein
MEDIKNAYNMMVGKIRGKDSVGYADVVGKIILKWSSGK